jgi:hypothetical protein
MTAATAWPRSVRLYLVSFVLVGLAMSVLGPALTGRAATGAGPIRWVSRPTDRATSNPNGRDAGSRLAGLSDRRAATSRLGVRHAH